MAFEISTGYIIITISCVIGILYALLNAYLVSIIDPMSEVQSGLADQEDGAENKNALMCEIGRRISEVIICLFREPTSSYSQSTSS